MVGVYLSLVAAALIVGIIIGAAVVSEVLRPLPKTADNDDPNTAWRRGFSAGRDSLADEVDRLETENARLRWEIAEVRGDAPSNVIRLPDRGGAA